MLKKIVFAFSFFIASSAFAGFDEGFAAFQKKDYAAALKEWQPLAKQGNVAAQFNLGYMFQNGLGVKKDSTKAAEWYLKAAEKSDAEAQFKIGQLLLDGQGVKKNEAKAAEWFKKSAEQGNAEAQAYLGDLFKNGQGVAKNPTEAASWYLKAAEQGHAGAQFMVGRLYHDAEGVTKDLAESVKWTQKAADQGSILAQSDLGDRYYDGDGVPKDLTTSANWFTKAAEQGNAHAQYALGFMYQRGQGVSRDEFVAMNWLRKAAAQGNESAKKEIARIEDVQKQARIQAEQQEIAKRKWEAEERKRLSQIGQQICRNLDGITLSQPIPYVVMGAQQYHENKGEAKVSGFVEGASGDRIQIRISSITFVNTTEVAQTNFDVNNKGIVTNVQMTSLSGYKGSVLRSDGIIWDDYKGWSTCN